MSGLYNHPWLRTRCSARLPWLPQVRTPTRWEGYIPIFRQVANPYMKLKPYNYLLQAKSLRAALEQELFACHLANVTIDFGIFELKRKCMKTCSRLFSVFFSITRGAHER